MMTSRDAELRQSERDDAERKEPGYVNPYNFSPEDEWKEPNPETWYEDNEDEFFELVEGFLNAGDNWLQEYGNRGDGTGRPEGYGLLWAFENDRTGNLPILFNEHLIGHLEEQNVALRAMRDREVGRG